MKIAISQPAYLPWLGYFDLIDQVDTFVLLDCVQFEKQSWQHRNRIKTPTGLQWLTVPVTYRGHFGQMISDVLIRDAEFTRNHLRAIELNYRRTPYFERYFSEFVRVLESYRNKKLLDLTHNVILWFRQILGIQTPLVLASGLGGQGKRSELLVSLCRLLDAEDYVSPLGSAAYLISELPLFDEVGINVAFQHYEHPQYRQLFPPFVSHASVLDLIFNEGPESLAILRNGRRATFAPSEVMTAMVSAEKQR